MDPVGKTCAHDWLVDSLLRMPEAFPKRIFGCTGVYARGKLLLVVSDGEEPWNGAFFPVERVHHAEVMARWPALSEHPILGKWLYLPSVSECFETLGAELVGELLRGNPLLGVVPAPKGKKKGGKTPAPKDDAASIIPPHLRC